jgi:HSP20 family protein
MGGPWKSFREIERWVRNLESSMPRAFEGEPFDIAVPAVESFVKAGNLVLRADVPGINPKDIEVNLLGDVLTIKGERKEDHEVKRENYIRREISYGVFERRISLPNGVDTSKVKATSRHGIIEITIPLRAEAAELKKINVEVAPTERANPKVNK